MSLVRRFPFAFLLLAACAGSPARTDGGDAEVPDSGAEDAREADAGTDAPAVPTQDWPGGKSLLEVDDAEAFPNNLSGLAHQPAQSDTDAVLWAVRNEPSTLFRLLWNGSVWRSDSAAGYAAGKSLRFPSGLSPDSEDLSLGAYGSDGRYVYVASEGTNGADASEPAILRFDTATAGSTLDAINVWDLSRAVPSTKPNAGIEALGFVPDAELTDFHDTRTDTPYVPADFGEHGEGVFFVGVEETGMIYGFVLDHETDVAQRVAAFPSGLESVAALSYDADRQRLWAHCDDTCGGRTAILALDHERGSPTFGQFVPTRILKRPGDMPNMNSEGMAITPDGECANGVKPVYWAEDGATKDHAIRRGTVACTGEL